MGSFLDKLRKEQQELAKRVIVKNSFGKLKTIAAADQSFLSGNRIISAIVSFTFPDLEEKERAYSLRRVSFSYIPGFLSYREAPPIIAAFRKLKQKPDILLIDGNGILHPLRIGIASHVGVMLNQPTIGVAKSLLCGKVEKEKVYLDGMVVGRKLSTKKGCKPIYVSLGHRVSLKTSVKIVKECLLDHKLPEPLRIAHLYANELKNNL